ncbi:Uncharacterised protein [Elizabethkingia miricola]|nr:Uncharacterised protein [Elizabethkingia miricola]
MNKFNQENEYVQVKDTLNYEQPTKFGYKYGLIHLIFR